MTVEVGSSMANAICVSVSILGTRERSTAFVVDFVVDLLECQSVGYCKVDSC